MKQLALLIAIGAIGFSAIPTANASWVSKALKKGKDAVHHGTDAIKNAKDAINDGKDAGKALVGH
jgi:hypothetical protein